MIEVSNYESSLFLFRDLEEKDANQLLKIYSDKEAMKYRRNPPMIDIEAAILALKPKHQKNMSFLNFSERSGEKYQESQ